MLELYLQCNGACAIASVNSNLYAFVGGFGGEPDEYYRPTIYTVANPYLKFNKNLKIDDDCVIIPNDSLFIGLLPMFNKYASQLVENDLSMTFGAFCKVIRPKICCPKYIGHFFNSPYYRKKISASSAGANINNIRNNYH